MTQCGGEVAPSVSFVVATWQEARAIVPCLDRLLSQEFDGEVEVLVVDGGSTDGTRELVLRRSSSDKRVRLLDNPRRIAASAFNLGVSASRAPIISLVGAHSLPPLDYARRLVAAFDESGAWLVGGRAVMESAIQGAIPEGIARAMASPLAVGNARYRYSTEPGWGESGFPGAYRRELFDVIGWFDEELVRNQDDDFHLRARKAGYSLWYEPELATVYHPRQNFGALWSQYYEYGIYRAATLRKHRQLSSARQAAPATLIAGLTLCGVAAPVWRPARFALAGMLAAWGTLLCVASLHSQDRDTDPEQVLATAVAVAVVQSSYGVGFWRGLLRRSNSRARLCSEDATC